MRVMGYDTRLSKMINLLEIKAKVTNYEEFCNQLNSKSSGSNQTTLFTFVFKTEADVKIPFSVDMSTFPAITAIEGE